MVWTKENKLSMDRHLKLTTGIWLKVIFIMLFVYMYNAVNYKLN